MALDTGPIEARLRQFANNLGDGADQGAAMCMQELLARSSQLVPIEEGTLQNTGRVVSGAGGAACGYGTGGAEAYAVAQHERVDYRHDNGRQAKFLEQPHRQMAGDGTYLRVIGRSAERRAS
jgi:hypothetical protein